MAIIYLGNVHPAIFNVISSVFPDITCTEFDSEGNAILACDSSLPEADVNKYMRVIATFDHWDEIAFLHGIMTFAEFADSIRKTAVSRESIRLWNKLVAARSKPCD